VSHVTPRSARDAPFERAAVNDQLQKAQFARERSIDSLGVYCTHPHSLGALVSRNPISLEHDGTVFRVTFAAAAGAQQALNAGRFPGGFEAKGLWQGQTWFTNEYYTLSSSAYAVRDVTDKKIVIDKLPSGLPSGTLKDVLEKNFGKVARINLKQANSGGGKEAVVEFEGEEGARRACSGGLKLPNNERVFGCRKYKRGR